LEPPDTSQASVIAQIQDVAQSVTWTAVGVLGFSILSGGGAMAWRLGRLEQKVDDVKDRVDRMDVNHR
jgi:hypothetical protein